MTTRLYLRCLSGALLAGIAATPAFAHHPMDGMTPTTFGQGLLSGLGHPVIGLDHLAFIIAAGVLSSRMAGWLLLPGAFVLAGLLGAVLHLNGMDLPGAEIGIALSVLVLGVAVMTARRFPPAVVAGLFALAGLVHGYALAESIIGAEPAPLGAYLIGLSVVQYAIAVGVGALARRLGDPASKTGQALPRAVGAVVALAGIAFLGSGLLA